MNTKNMLLIGIAVFAISLLLTSPVLASADKTLDIYGNANEDDTIDMRDLTYVKLIFFGKKPETELADAKYDGKINPLDFVQIKLIIVGKEKQLTIVDDADRIVTVNKPVKRVIAFYTYFVEPLRTLDAADKIVGVDELTKKSPKVYFGEICDLPSVGYLTPDYEALFSLEPDLFLMTAKSYADKVVDTLESNDPDLPILRMNVGSGEYGEFNYVEEMRKLGYVFGKREEAEEFIDWYAGIVDLIKSRTDELADDEKPRVLYGNLKKGGNEWFAFGRKSGVHKCLGIAGARNIAVDVDFGEKGCGYVDLEWVIVQNPEIIVRYYSSGIRKSYAIDDTTEIIAHREEVLDHPALAEVDAVMNEKVQMISYGLVGSPRHLIGIAYLAKIFHPDLFDDLDPQAIHQEWLTRFQHIDYDLDKHGVFVYPEPS